MKKLIAVLMALTTVLTFAGCSETETTLTSEDIFDEPQSYTTTTFPPFTMSPETTAVTEEVIIHRSSPHMEELLVGILNAIGSHNEEEYNTYISPEYHNHKKYGYEAVHGQFVEALYRAGYDHKAIYTYEDFTAFEYAKYNIYFNENPDAIQFYIGLQSLNFDIETETYSISGIAFSSFEGSYEDAKRLGTLLDLSAYATEVTE